MLAFFDNASGPAQEAKRADFITHPSMATVISEDHTLAPRRNGV